LPFRKRVFVVFAIACVGATLYEIPNGWLVWRNSRDIRRSHAASGSKGVPAALPNEVVATDPEAGDILTYCLGDPNDEDLARLVARYPRNEFFLAQLTERLLDVNCVDHQAPLTLADKLVTMSPENAHYRYLKGWILLKPPRDAGCEQKAREQFELGNGLPQFYLPFSRYKERMDRLCDGADMSFVERSKAWPSQTGIYFDLARFITRSQRPHATFEPETFDDLTAPIIEIGKRVIANGQTFSEFTHGMFLLQFTETARLRQLNLSSEQAWQSRLHLSQAIAINEVLQRWYLEAFTSGAAIAKKGLVAVVPLALGLQLPFIWLFMIIVNLVRGRAHPNSVCVKAYALFTLGLVSSPCLLILVAFANKRLPGSFLASVICLSGPIIVGVLLWLLAHLPPLDHRRFRRGRRWATVVFGGLLGLAMVLLAMDAVWNNRPEGIRDWLRLAGAILGCSGLGAAMWPVAAYRQHVFRAIPYDGILRSRFVQTIMLLSVATGIITVTGNVPIVPIILSFVTVLLVGTIAVHCTEHRIILCDILPRFFAKQGQSVVTRTKLAHLTLTTLLVFWLTILVGVHLSAGKWRRLETMRTDPLALYGPLPQATPDIYERMILASEPKDSGHRPWDQDAGVPERIHMATLADVTAFLAKRQTEGRTLSDSRLLQLASQGGYDIRPAVLGVLKEPNALEALLRRAEWGDAEVKEQLVAHFEEQFAKLGKPYAQIRQDPNCLASLVMKAGWGDEAAKTELDRRFTLQMTELLKAPQRTMDRERLCTELSDLVTINETLINLSRHGHIARSMRKTRERSNLLDRLLAGADMLDLEPAAEPSDVPSELLESLFDIAGALAFVSEPPEAKIQLQWLMAPLLEQQRQDRDRSRRSRRKNPGWTTSPSWSFYRALRGMPQSQAGALLKEYLGKSQLADPFEDTNFLDVFRRARDRALAEWVLQRVAEAAPSRTAYDVSVGRIVHLPEDIRTYRQDTSHKYLEAAFPHLNNESTPLLLQYVDSGNESLRAFAVWRLTALGYDWPTEQVRLLLADNNWKVRLNTLFACDADDLARSLTDDNHVVRAVARMLIKRKGTWSGRDQFASNPRSAGKRGLEAILEEGVDLGVGLGGGGVGVAVGHGDAVLVA